MNRKPTDRIIILNLIYNEYYEITCEEMEKVLENSHSYKEEYRTGEINLYELQDEWLIDYSLGYCYADGATMIKLVDEGDGVYKNKQKYSTTYYRAYTVHKK